MQDGDNNKKDKKNKKGDKEHHHHHHKHDKSKELNGPKPTGPAPTPPISLADQIVREMHSDPLPSPTSHKVPSPTKSMPSNEPVKAHVVDLAATEQLGVIATFLKWIKDNVLHPTFSRQNQISKAYSDQFSQTVSAIQKRFSANDARIETLPKALRFSGTEDSSSIPSADISVTSTVPKPTIH